MVTGQYQTFDVTIIKPVGRVENMLKQFLPHKLNLCVGALF